MAVSFLEEAKQILTEQEFIRLELLIAKFTGNIETPEEEKELSILRNKVRAVLQEREALKGLEVLKSGNFTLSQVLKTLNPTEKELKSYIKANFKTASTKEPITVGKVKYLIDGAEKEGEIIFNAGTENKAPREMGEAVRNAKEAGFVKMLSPEGLAWVSKTHTATAGPTKGSKVWDNINQVATRFKFDKATLIKAIEKATK